MGKSNTRKGFLGVWSFAKMCLVVCFNSQWRSVVIGTVSCLSSLFLLFLTVGYQDVIVGHLEAKIANKGCYEYSEVKLLHQPDGIIDKSVHYTHMTHTKMVNWTRTLQTEENECIFVAFAVLFPWPLWTALGTYAILNLSLIASATYKNTAGVTVYLSLDACYVGIIAAALCMSFFPKGLTRIGLLTLLFPLFSLALCAWMTVFGFYLRLEDREKRKEKRQLSRQAIEKGISGAAYWLEQQQKQLEGTNEIYNRAGYSDLSDDKCGSRDAVESQFINLAFEFDEKRALKKPTTMQELELEMVKKHYNQ